MSSLLFCEKRTLKLTNVLQYKLNLEYKTDSFDVVLDQMKTYLEVNGANQVGPVIQYSSLEYNDIKKSCLEVYIMLQADKFIENVKHPYSMERNIRIPNAFYCRYTGPSNLLKYGFDKIGVEAFERNTILQNVSYTVFVEESDTRTVADIFVPMAM